MPGGPERANWLLRAGAVVLFQLGALLGTAVLWWRVRRIGPAGVTVASLCAGCLALLAASVVAPQLSGSYGLLRLFQQALVVLGPAVIVALVTVVGWASRRSERVTGAVTGAVVVGCLLSTSGFVPQLTGGYPPQLNLNNAGGYYHAYLATDADVRTARWIERNVRLDDVVSADSRDAGNLRSLTQKETREGMVPGAVPRGDYVVLTSTDGRTVTATAVAGDRVLRYSFPLDCVAGGRPLLYTDGEHRVYGQVRAAP